MIKNILQNLCLIQFYLTIVQQAIIQKDEIKVNKMLRIIQT